ncbi:MAG: FeoB-associated Cys-rich membrane protein [Acidobacteriota bacterium]|nr:FeoB-associated Cys-rich membrane protein [Acidobacteriota bacterium]
MTQWIAANAASLIVGALVVIALIFAVRSILKQRRKGGCGQCPSAGTCRGEHRKQ